jgi:SecD/SecF fusion protein
MKISKIILSVLIFVLVLFEGCFSPKAEYEIKAVMEISEDNIIRDLSVNRRDTTLNQAIALALKRRAASRQSFVELFGKAFTEIDRDRPLAALFLSRELKERITYNSTNQDVLKVLEEEISTAINKSYNILLARIDNFGIPKRKRKIEITGNRMFITIKTKYDNPERIIGLFEPQGNLEFWETYELKDIYEHLLAANAVIRYKLEQSDQQEEEPLLPEQLMTDSGSVDSEEQAPRARVNEFPLFYILRPRIDNTGNIMRGSAVGRVHFKDTAEVTRYLNIKQARDLFPADIKFLWSAYAIKQPEAGRKTDLYELHAIKGIGRDGSAALYGDLITKAHYNFNRKWGTNEIHLSMNPEGTVNWARFTHQNIGRTIAIVIDKLVYSAPVVQEEIRSGRAVISGNFSIDEAQDLANIINSTAGQRLSGKLRIISLEVTKAHRNNIYEKIKREKRPDGM